MVDPLFHRARRVYRAEYVDEYTAVLPQTDENKMFQWIGEVQTTAVPCVVLLRAEVWFYFIPASRLCCLTSHVLLIHRPPVVPPAQTALGRPCSACCAWRKWWPRVSPGSRLRRRWRRDFSRTQS